MSQPDCPACQRSAVDNCEFVDVGEQHKFYAPDVEEVKQALTAAAAKRTLNYQMLRCQFCGLEFCDPMCAPSREWYNLAYRAMDLYALERWEFGEVLRRIPRGARLFEFGCGSGNFLTRCLENQIPASGMDFSEDGVASCVSKGLDVSRIDLDEITSGGTERVSHLAAFHFLEHLERPSALFEHAAAKASPDSHLWVSVPSDRRATRRFGVIDHLDQPPHHMTRWTPEAFRQIGKRSGWRLTEILYEPVQLRVALWSITVYSPAYQRLKTAGKFQNRMTEQAYRAIALPGALMRRLSSEQILSGFAMLAHFTRDAHSESAYTNRHAS